MVNDNITQLKDMIAHSGKVLIAIGENPDKDTVSASCALYLVLEKLGKEIKIVCPTDPTVEFSDIVGVNRMTSSLPTGNFIISFDYIEGAIEKVSYNVENGKFNLTIHSGSKAPALSPDKIHYTQPGGSFDTVIVVGTSNLSFLGNLYQRKQEGIEKLINIDYHPQNNLFGDLNFVDKSASSVSEIITGQIRRMDLKLDVDSASNLFLGIAEKTNNLNLSLVSAQTLEAAAFCLKSGARRPQVREAQVKEIFEEIPDEAEEPIPDWKQDVNFAASEPVDQANPVDQPNADDIEPSWLRPKIYKSTSSL